MISILANLYFLLLFYPNKNYFYPQFHLLITLKKQTTPNTKDPTYNSVAELYAQTFSDIKVREDEWEWIAQRIPKDEKLILVDLGCGNGALLKELATRIGYGYGLDASENMLRFARESNQHHHNLEFIHVTDSRIPLPDKSVDIIISMLSFRYVNWENTMAEMKRILKPGGRILLVDMVSTSVQWFEFPQFLLSKWKQFLQKKKNPVFYNKLLKLVNDPAWEIMLKHNPIQPFHKMKRFLESEFPERKVGKINIGWRASVVAFDSGKL
jgi:ubiquinone/menaquinone biosynthesis C-methylase UbiE